MRKVAIAILTTGALLIMAGLRADDLRWLRADIVRRSDARAANLALMLSEYFSETFSAGDAALRQLALHSRRIGGPTAPGNEWDPSLEAAQVDLTSFNTISIVDRHGIVRHSTWPEAEGQSWTDRYVFQQAIRTPGDDLIVGVPFMSEIGRPELVLPVGRRLFDLDGSFDGVAIAWFRPAAPQAFLRTVNVGKRGALWEFSTAGIMLCRAPASPAFPPGSSARHNPIFTHARQTREGTVHAPVEPGGPVMLSAFRRASGAPLILAVSIERDEILADWWREARNSAILFALSSAVFVLTIIVLFRQMDAKERAEQALSEARVREAIRLRDVNDQLASALDREQVARRDAEMASTLKDQFLMTVSHELRTPLTAIYGWARMLLQGAVPERQKENALRTIERNAYAQTRLIDDLLDVSGIMGGKLRLEVHVVNIEEIVRNAVETVSPAASAKGIRIDTTIDRAVGPVSGDPDRLQQIVWNLLSNAVKFTPNGGRVTVTVARLNGEIEIAVRDTGIGISPEFLPHVFDRFRQEETGTGRRHGGLGLGMAIVRNLVELHGGTVNASSEGVGGGATFRVRLPTPTASPFAEEAPAVSPLAEATAGANRLDGVRVLVVDDDREARALFGTILEIAGAIPTLASSPAEALALLRTSTHDVILADIEMPGADGYALVREALAIARWRGERLMAVAVTAYSRPEADARASEAGFHRLIQKPIEPSSLIAVIRSIWPAEISDET